MTPKQLYEVAQNLYSKRSQLMSLWQETANNFYPERADFTVKRSIGDNFADDLTTSYPLLARRDLGNSLGAMLRPSGQEWFHIGLAYDEKVDNDGQRWLEYAATTQRKAMYDRDSLFLRATKEGDHDYAAFGQTVISVELNRYQTALLYRCWHLRDCAWVENEDGKIGARFRRWKPTARDLIRMFGDKVHTNVTQKAEKDPFCEIECMHMVVPQDMFDGDFKRFPWVSIYYDYTHDSVLEVVGSYGPIYIIPRWETVSGSQYAYSPAVICALPEARLIQAMTVTLLQAGEKAVDPPMWGYGEAFRSDLDIQAGGFTWVDREYDERTGPPINILANDKSGIPLGIDMQKDSRALIAECFYLNKLAMPPSEREMTAYETAQRIQEYIRQAMPLFEPIEMDYNAAICEETFALLLRAGAFGSVYQMPQSLQGKNVQFKFQSPLHDAIERQKSQLFMEGKALTAEAMGIDPTASALLDVKSALRGALRGIRYPADWTRSEAEVTQIDTQLRQQQQTQNQLATFQQGADVAKTLNEARAAVPA